MVFSAHANKEVIVAYGDYPPWVGKDLKGYGLVNEVVKEAFKRKGYTVKFNHMPWARCEKMLQAGRADLSVPYYKNEERLKKYNYSTNSVAVIKIVLYKNANNTKTWQNISELKKMRIGGSRGNYYGKIYEEFVKTLDKPAQVSNNDEIGLKKLVKNRVDYFVVGSEVGKFLSKKLGIESKVSYDKNVINEQNTYAIFSKKSDPKKLIDFDAAISEMAKEEKYKHLLSSEM